MNKQPLKSIQTLSLLGDVSQIYFKVNFKLKSLINEYFVVLILRKYQFACLNVQGMLKQSTKILCTQIHEYIIAVFGQFSAEFFTMLKSIF